MSKDETSIVLDELKKEINQSLVFVQIVQRELFRPDPDDRPNYCFVEWGWAKDRFGDEEDCILYISGEADRDWENLAPHAPLAQWYSHVKEKKGEADAPAGATARLRGRRDDKVPGANPGPRHLGRLDSARTRRTVSLTCPEAGGTVKDRGGRRPGRAPRPRSGVAVCARSARLPRRSTRSGIRR
jgi:hypothetical protein